MKKYVKKIFFYGIALPSQKDDILKFNQYIKSDKTPCLTYAEFESLIEKIDERANNPQKSSLQIFNVNNMDI